MSAFTIDRQGKRNPVSGYRRGRPFSVPDEFYLADLINFGNFQSWIPNSVANSFYLIADSELVFHVGCRAKTDPKFTRQPVERTLNPQ